MTNHSDSAPRALNERLRKSCISHWSGSRDKGTAMQTVDDVLNKLTEWGYVVLPRSEVDEMLAAYVMQAIR